MTVNIESRDQLLDLRDRRCQLLTAKGTRRPGRLKRLALSGWAFLGPLGVQFDVMLPRSRDVVLIENGFHRALRNAGFTVDAPIGMNVEHAGVLVKAIGWADPQARLVFAAFAWFSHDHRHNVDPRVRIVGNSVVTRGGENLNDKADNDFQKKSDSKLANLASRELVELWQSGSQDAAQVLLARYEVRLIALVASRINRKYQGQISPDDVVQSALGSFFRATRASANPSIKLESTASAWNILATFARRKLSRALEREAAAKRGGGQNRMSLDDLEEYAKANPSQTAADEMLADLRSLLNQDQLQLLGLLLVNATQREIAEQLRVDERTIRRRVTALRELFTGRLASTEEQHASASDALIATINLPKISYREFVLGKLVGSGALGKVYRARLQSDGRVVAVKFMHRHLWHNPDTRLSFLREIDHASKIEHAGVVKYYGWGQSPHGGPYLVCEYIHGQPITTISPKDSAASVQWLIQICEAVAASHQAGVIHGDLTPNNILLDDRGRIVITDFGFATYAQHLRTDSTESVAIASPGGTLGFAAPEQISSAFGTISVATDIYALGGLAYYLLTGRSPHDTQSLLDTVADEDVYVPNSNRSQADTKLAAIASLALRKAIDSRPQSVAELMAILARSA